MQVWFVDAFTHVPFSGNPAAVIPVHEFPNSMQHIAAELNLSQTAFLKHLGSNVFHLRWFSPKDEAPICGHATLAAAHVVFEEGLCLGSSLKFQTLAGELLVKKQGHDLEMIFPKKELIPSLNKEKVSLALSGATIQDLYEDDLIYVAVLKTVKEVERVMPDFERIKELPKRAISITANALGSTVRGNFGCDFVSRYFAPKVGIFEDPVCGSAHCRLAPFWANRLGRHNLFAYQVSDRGGCMRLFVESDAVRFQAQAVTVSRAQLFLEKTSTYLKVA